MTEEEHPLEWPCHFCGEVRPDALIKVRSVSVVMAVDIPVKLTRRFCVDRDECRQRANEWAEETTTRFRKVEA